MKYKNVLLVFFFLALFVFQQVQAGQQYRQRKTIFKIQLTS
jgi:hypothetical protein